MIRWGVFFTVSMYVCILIGFGGREVALVDR